MTALLEYLDLSAIFLWAYMSQNYDYSIGVSPSLKCQVAVLRQLAFHIFALCFKLPIFQNFAGEISAALITS